MSYTNFALMIFTSILLMFGLMYLNTYQVSHIWFSETRAFVALVMGATMTVVMLGFMWKHYRDAKIKTGIMSTAVLVFTGSLWLVRSQATVEDVYWMKAMIPHHSIAILTSSRAQIKDPAVRDLADRIISSQTREIDEMKRHLDDLGAGRPATKVVDGARVSP